MNNPLFILLVLLALGITMIGIAAAIVAVIRFIDENRNKEERKNEEGEQ